MASTYSPNLRLELIGTGEQQGTWGSTTNTNLGTLLEEAIGGYVSVTVSDVADTTLTTSNGSADQSRNMVINLTGALTATRNVICPAIEKLYVVKNATTGGQSVVFKVSGQTGVTIPNGIIEFIYVDGTDARSITGSIAIQDANNVAITGGSITGITDLAVADGGTGASNAASARTNLGIGTIGTQNANAVAITGGTIVANASSLSVRDSDGSNILSIAVGSNLTANTILTLTTGATSNRTLDISASNVTISTAGAALIDDADASAQRTTLGLGTIATQNANAVSITGGSITGITDLAVADGGTGASDAATARTNLGVGTLGTQNANAVAITGGTIVANASGISIRDADASNVMTIAVGSNLTANTVLTLTTGAASNRTLDISASNVTVSVAGAALIDDADASAQRTTLGLGTGSSPEFTAVNIGNASDTTVSRSSAGVIAVEGKPVVMTTGAQTVEFAAGTVSLPAITTTGDTNTGIFFPAADTIAFAEGGAEAMRIDSSGNVSIGTSSALGNLGVQRAASSLGWMVNAKSNGVANESGIFVDASNNVEFAARNGSGVLNVRLGSSGDSWITGVNFGVGTSSPATRLHVDGTIRYTNRPAAGTVTAIGYDTNGDLKNSSSSLRYKYDVTDYGKGLDVVMQLRPVTFKFNGETRENAGFIAEEIEALGLTEVMLYDEEDRPEGVLYANMVALLTKALQEANSKIDALEARIAALEAA
jgi:hypothetical protein